jgi:CRP/FNR family nitrogen fixation transcriptional regulator
MLLLEGAMRNFDTDFIQGGAGSSAAPRVEFAGGIAAPGFIMAFARNEEIYGEEEEADFIYRVVTGVVRTTHVLQDGRRQVTGFFYPGDVFGLETAEAHETCAEAVVECRVALFRRGTIERAAEQDLGTARALRSITVRHLERTRAQLAFLAHKSATERVAAFLADMSARADDPRSIILPMSRVDIADYLGLTFETVSRSFTQLERDGVIALPASRRVEVRRPDALGDYQS